MSRPGALVAGVVRGVEQDASIIVDLDGGTEAVLPKIDEGDLCADAGASTG